ncbi:MarR family winged helix-turn-helix transcriptional regulator [Chachezhania sediminis]|uniref:MarR family winged helix-turn-helix transcriptional regulator n=1 Tax=Chachezhania sediminis TaxID=2599291 RepID=UPI00131E711D|nr:MarR family transcriptional regulator [Chachezhania sediminis]
MNEQSPPRRKAPPHLCPDARLSTSTKVVDGRPVIDTESYIPYYLTAVNSALTAGASAVYLRDFGIGVTEWRVLSTLAADTGLSAVNIAEHLSMDKGAVSRALRQLEQLGYATTEPAENDGRRRMLAITPTGLSIHDRILAVALERERDLIRGVDPEDLEAFLRVMRILRLNVRAL